MTGGQTNMSTKNTLEMQKAMELAIKLTNDKNVKLCEYLKSDTTLGRDQNIGLGKESTLASSEVMVIPGGVKLQEFGPDKYVDDYSRQLEEKDKEGEEGEEDQEDPMKMGRRRQGGLNKNETFEEKMTRRKADEAQGLLMPRVTTSELNGGPYILAGHMSRDYYKKNYNHFGTIGQMIQ